MALWVCTRPSCCCPSTCACRGIGASSFDASPFTKRSRQAPAGISGDRPAVCAGERRHLGIDVFGGSLNVRKMRGGESYSMHSWGIAIDFDPERNALGWNQSKARLAAADAADFWKIWEGEGWVSMGRARDFDWMQVQAATPMNAAMPRADEPGRLSSLSPRGWDRRRQSGARRSASDHARCRDASRMSRWTPRSFSQPAANDSRSLPVRRLLTTSLAATSSAPWRGPA